MGYNPAGAFEGLTPAGPATPGNRRFQFKFTGSIRKGHKAQSPEEAAFDRFVRAQQGWDWDWDWDRAFAALMTTVVIVFWLVLSWFRLVVRAPFALVTGAVFVTFLIGIAVGTGLDWIGGAFLGAAFGAVYRWAAFGLRREVRMAFRDCRE